ncbi:MAG: hypothetical protein AAGF12_34060 [Myxococcota bacterium]
MARASFALPALWLTISGCGLSLDFQQPGLGDGGAGSDARVGDGGLMDSNVAVGLGDAGVDGDRPDTSPTDASGMDAEVVDATIDAVIDAVIDATVDATPDANVIPGCGNLDFVGRDPDMDGIPDPRDVWSRRCNPAVRRTSFLTTPLPSGWTTTGSVAATAGGAELRNMSEVGHGGSFDAWYAEVGFARDLASEHWVGISIGFSSGYRLKCELYHDPRRGTELRSSREITPGNYATPPAPLNIGDLPEVRIIVYRDDARRLHCAAAGPTGPVVGTRPLGSVSPGGGLTQPVSAFTDFVGTHRLQHVWLHEAPISPTM